MLDVFSDVSRTRETHGLFVEGSMNIEKERRNTSRIQLNRQVRLEFPRKVYQECLIQDLSLTGMFVHGDIQQKEGDRCVVNLVQEGKHSYLSLEASAQVVRKNGKGVAITFTAMPLESVMLLQIILQCENAEGILANGIESLDNLPFKVHDDLLR